MRNKGPVRIFFLVCLCFVLVKWRRFWIYETEREQRLPDCIIFGVKKGGTKTLLDFIDHHPEVEVSPKEVDFFNTDILYRRGLDWYRSKMPPTWSWQKTLEKSPNYFSSPKTPKRIYEMNSDIKLVLAVRDPVDRAISDLLQSYVKPNVSFEDLVFLDNNMARVNSQWLPMQISTYWRHLEHWLAIFPLRQILLVECSDLAANPAKQLQRIENFIGLTPYFTEDNFFLNASKGFMCFRHNATDPGHCMGSNKGRPHPVVLPEALSALRKHFAGANEKFFKQIEHTYNWPTK